MRGDLFPSLALGIAVGGFLFFALARGEMGRPRAKALAVACFSIGAATSWWLLNHPARLAAALELVADRSIAMVLAAVAAGLAFWRLRSLP